MSDLKRLTQNEAAGLLGTNARSLRDDGTIPRNADGSYSAADLVAWSRGRTRPVQSLADGDYESLLKVADTISDPPDCQAVAIVEVVNALRAKLGDTVLAEFGEILLRRWTATAEGLEKLADDPDHQRRQLESAKRAAALDAKRDRLEFVAVCLCGKHRSGRKWSFKKLSPDVPTIPVSCPDCDGEQ